MGQTHVTLFRQGLQAVFLSVSVVLGACGDQGARSLAIVRDSAGLRIVENPAVPWEDLLRWQVDSAPWLSIGVVEGDPAYQLFRVTGAVRLSDGRMAVANAGTQEIRVYDPRGVHVISLGGEGEGPGEFKGLRRMLRLQADSLLAHDWRQSRMTLFAPDGRLVRTWRVGELAPFQIPPPIGRLAGGDFVAHIESWGAEPPGLIEYTTTLVRYSHDGNVLDTIVRSPGGHGYYDWCGPDRRAMCQLHLPFRREGHAAVYGARLLVGNGERYEIRSIDVNGRLVELWRRLGPLRSVTDRDIEQDRAALLALARTDERRRTLEQQYAQVPVPDVMPAFSDLLVDSEGNLWVEEYRPRAETRSRFTVFDSLGQIVGAALMPEGLEVLDIGRDYVLGLWRDEADVEFIHVHSLRRPR